MALDPQIATLLPMLASAPPLRETGIDGARAGMRLLLVDMRDASRLPPVRSTEDVTYPTPNGNRPARVYRPEVDGPVPTVLFLHGGGFVMGDIDTHEDQARLLCAEVGAVVISIDYRLAPEHPFPAGYLDAVAALEHVFATVDALGGDATRIAVAGDSAGGNLSAGAAIAARDLGLPLKAQLLIYPSTDFHEHEWPSRVEHADSGLLLNRDDMMWFRECYQPDVDDVRASVLQHPDLSGVAPAIVSTGEYDPLRDEGEAYAEALERAGVSVLLRRADDMIHGFFGMGAFSEAAHKAALQLCADLKDALA
ncbi:MAG: Alpha/beta hydrolase fold-3 domain protein [Frankiales bacterium]|nr:Alpha/beta hydrolase fold-3 domain protein [Frankiales bacterium]